MNNQGDVTTDWADGTYTFRLTVNGLIELEEKCDAAFGVVFARLNSGVWKVSDVLETLRIGLIGGGMVPTEAKKIVDRYALPLTENLPVARAVIAGAMFGFATAPLEKKAPAPTAATGASMPPLSSEPQFDLAGIQASLDELASGNFTRQ